MRSSRQILLWSTLAMLCSVSTGCSLDRSWFQMSSDSPMPFFGFDLRMPRKSAQLEPVNHEEQLAKHWNNESNIRPVGHKKTTNKSQTGTQRLQLPKISTLLESGQEEELSFTGPKTPFSR